MLYLTNCNLWLSSLLLLAAQAMLCFHSPNSCKSFVLPQPKLTPFLFGLVNCLPFCLSYFIWQFAKQQTDSITANLFWVSDHRPPKIALLTAKNCLGEMTCEVRCQQYLKAIRSIDTNSMIVIAVNHQCINLKPAKQITGLIRLVAWAQLHHQLFYWHSKSSSSPPHP